MWRQLSGWDKLRFGGLVLGLLAGVSAFIIGVMIHNLGGWLQAAAAASVFFSCVSRLNKLAAQGRGAGALETDTSAPQTHTTDTRPVSRVKADDGYFKKCAACGKFTRDAKVCRHCGDALPR